MSLIFTVLASALEPKDLFLIAGIVVALIAAAAALAAFIWWKFAGETATQKTTAAGEWRGIADGQKERIDDLDQQVQTWKMAHQKCEGKINAITQFNLRLQARERGYQRTINRLEIKAGLEPTDFNDITDAPCFSS